MLLLLTLFTAAHGAPEPERMCPPPKRNEAFALFHGQASGATEPESLEAARKVARDRAASALCRAAFETKSCDHRTLTAAEFWTQRATFQPPLKGRNAAPGTWSACYAYGVRHDHLKPLHTKKKRFLSQLPALSQKLHAKGIRHVDLQSPRWGTGCTLGVPGDAIRSTISKTLVSTNIVVSPPQGFSTRPLLMLKSSVDELHLLVDVQLKHEGTVQSLMTLEIPRELYRVPDAPKSSCNLESARTVGVRVGLSDDRVAFCHGDQIEASVHVDGPAWVRLLSVDGDGEVHQIWPYRLEHEGQVYERKDRLVTPDNPVRFATTAVTERFDTSHRLIAVATPERDQLDAWRDSVGVCRAPGTLAELPFAGMSVTGASYELHGSQDAVCEKVGDLTVADDAKEQLDGAKGCW